MTSRRPALALLCVLLAASTAPVRGQDPVITEFMADNDGTLVLPDTTTPDWIEIHNPGGATLDLAGWHLTDDPLDPTKWTFPAGATIGAGGYLLVHASGTGVTNPGPEYHASFALADQGEYLALVRPDGAVLQEFAPEFPRQYRDVSYGLPPSGGDYAFFLSPTPGAPNNESVQGFVRDTTFSHKRGFYDLPFQLQVTTATPGASLYYTTNGVTPDESSARVDAPDPLTPPVLTLDITGSTIVRVFAAKAGHVSTNIDTQSYLFPDQEIGQRNLAAAITQDPVWGPQMRDALLEIPSISLVTQEEIPTEPVQSPPEIPVSIEVIYPDGRDGIQADAGIERFGGQYTLYPKKALRVSFKAIYGPKRLKFDLFGDTPWGGESAVKDFDQILLRNGSHDSLFSFHYAHSRGAYIRNRYFCDRQLEAGHLSMRGRFVHVYLNGDYHGQYHLMERPTADFMASYQGGEEEDYDIMKGRSGIFPIQGNQQAWDHLVSNTGNWSVVQDYLDLDSYIDYMLLNFYGGNDHDWYPVHNWVAGRKREAGARFQFFMWDNDFLNRRGGNATSPSTANTIDNGGPGNMLGNLSQHPEFRIRLADRTQKHFFNGGMLTGERVQADFNELRERISRTIIPETARWAEVAQAFDARNGFYTPDSFHTYVDWIVDVNAPARTGIVLDQLRAAGLFPETAAPVFNQHGGFVAPGTPVTMATDADRIYYTLDGSDPRLPGGAPDPGALEATFTSGGGTKVTDPLYFSVPTLVRARSFDDSAGEWSALNEATFLIGTPAAAGNLVFSKIHYNPDATQGDLAEFIELMNISSEPVSLAGVRFTEGITFAFDDRDLLYPGQRAVLVADPAAFAAAYGPGVPVFGSYEARLANNGERVTLTGADNAVIRSLRYNDKAPWPVEADGGGHCLVLIAPSSGPDHELPENWRASVQPGGSPAADESLAFTGNPDTDLLAYALGRPELFTIGFAADGTTVLEIPRVPGADDAAVEVEVSTDLRMWTPADPVLLEQLPRNGTTSLTRWSLTPSGPDRQYARLVVTLRP